MEIKAFVGVVVVVAFDWDDDVLLSSLIIIPEANDLIVATT